MSTTATRIIACANCQAKNRVDPSRPNAKCGKCHEPLDLSRAAGPTHLTDANFADEVLRADLPVLVDCWAAWCGPCRAVAPIIDALSYELAGRVKVAKLDTEEARGTAQQLQIMSIPTLIVYRNGQVVGRQAGAGGAEQIKGWLQSLGVI